MEEQRRGQTVCDVQQGEEESVEHVLLRCTAYRSEREQLWELMEAECGLGEDWRWLEDEEKAKVLLGQVYGRRGEDRQECEELPKEGDGQKEKMDGTRDKNTMIIVCTRDGLQQAHTDSINYYYYHILAGLESGTLLIVKVSKFNLSLSVCNLTQS